MTVHCYVTFYSEKKNLEMSSPLFIYIYIFPLHTEKVWKVARYTSAAPIFLADMDDYLDGGVLANNPSVDGLATIVRHYRKMGQTLPISLVVSLGTGMCGQRIGSIDAQDIARWRMEPLMERVKNLATLLSTAVS